MKWSAGGRRIDRADQYNGDPIHFSCGGLFRGVRVFAMEAKTTEIAAAAWQ